MYNTEEFIVHNWYKHERVGNCQVCEHFTKQGKPGRPKKLKRTQCTATLDQVPPNLPFCTTKQNIFSNKTTRAEIDLPPSLRFWAVNNQFLLAVFANAFFHLHLFKHHVNTISVQNA